MTSNAITSQDRRAMFWLGLILVLAASLRIYRATSHSLCFDEMWHLAVATGNGSPQKVLPEDVLIAEAPSPTSLADAKPPWSVWANQQRIVHPPLEFVALNLWRWIFGGSDLAAQSLSIIASLFGIALLYDAARLSAGVRPALWACLVVAIAPVEIFLTQQVRAYAMLQAFALGAVWMLLRIELLGMTRRRAIGLGCFVLAMMLSHYFACGVVAALGIYALVRLRGYARKGVVIALATAGVVYAVIWGPFMLAQRQDVIETADNWLKEDRPDHLLMTLKRLASLPAMQLVDSPALNEKALYVGLVMFALAGVAMRRRELAVWAYLLAGTFGFVFLLDVFRSTTHLLYMRYTMAGVPAMLLLLCASLSRAHHLPGHLPGLLAAGFCFVGLGNLTGIYEEPDYRPLGDFVRRHVGDDEPMLFASAGSAPWYSEVLYLAAAHYSGRFPHPIVKLGKPADADVLRSLNARTAWVISPPADPRRLVPGCEVLDHAEIPPIAFCTRVKLPVLEATVTTRREERE